jgi:hypothetical protein
MANFRLHLRLENIERIRKATATTAGYHSANVAITTSNGALLEHHGHHTAAVANALPPVSTPPHQSIETVFVDGTDCRLYYCWTHGLGFSRNHTSNTCTNRATGHVETATFKNPQGGSNKVTMNTPRSRRPNPFTPAT